MADDVIAASAVQPTPAGYKVPPAQQIRVKSVRALVDGTGAAAAFLPTLQLVAPSGDVVWESATDATVAAGGSADVSWFPGVTAAAASTPSTTVSLPLVGGEDFNSQTFASNPASFPGWNWTNGDIETNSSIFTFSAFTPTLIRVSQPGFYIAWLGLVPDIDWPTAPTGQIGFGGVDSHSNTPSGLYPYAQHTPIDLFVPPVLGAGIMWAVTHHLVESGSWTWHAGIENKSGANFTFSEALFFLYRISDSIPLP